MVTELLIMWIVGVVAFFVLWAILLKVIKRISERKNKTENVLQKEASEKDISDEHSL
jgi:flagellar biosynthesis/type III secretory pathway M-ring protein FliF/YscJ